MCKVKRAFVVAHVASMIDLFNRRNIELLKELGYEVHIACNFQSGNVTSLQRVREFKEEMVSKGIKCFDIPFPRKITAIADIFQSYRCISELMREYEYELVHCQAPISGVITRLAVNKYRKKGTKVIYAAHGFHFLKGGPLKNWILFYPIERICARYTDCIITINNEDYERAEKFSCNKVEYIPGVGINTKMFDEPEKGEETIRESLGIPKEGKVLLTVGELTPGKNHELALRAFAKVKDKEIYYLICGIGKDEKRLKKLVTELHISDRVKFLGYRLDINNICHASNVFIFPSLREGLPVAVMEAMASGLPVICSDVRGNRDLIENNKGGIVIKGNNIEKYTDAIRMITADKRLSEQFGEFNKRKVKEYDKSIVDQAMLEIYKSILEV